MYASEPKQTVDALREFGNDIILSGPFVFTCAIVLASAYALRCCGLRAQYTTMVSLGVESSGSQTPGKYWNARPLEREEPPPSSSSDEGTPAPDSKPTGPKDGSRRDRTKDIEVYIRNTVQTGDGWVDFDPTETPDFALAHLFEEKEEKKLGNHCKLLTYVGPDEHRAEMKMRVG